MKVNKRKWIMEQPLDLAAHEVCDLARKAGIDLTPQYVYVTRCAAKKVDAAKAVVAERETFVTDDGRYMLSRAKVPVSTLGSGPVFTPKIVRFQAAKAPGGSWQPELVAALTTLISRAGTVNAQAWLDEIPAVVDSIV